MCSCCSFYLKVHLALKGSKKAKEGKNKKSWSGRVSWSLLSQSYDFQKNESSCFWTFCFDHKSKPQVMHCCPHMALCCYHFKSIVFWNVARPADPDVPKQSQTMFPPTCFTVQRFRGFFLFTIFPFLPKSSTTVVTSTQKSVLFSVISGFYLCLSIHTILTSQCGDKDLNRWLVQMLCCSPGFFIFNLRHDSRFCSRCTRLTAPTPRLTDNTPITFFSTLLIVTCLQGLWKLFCSLSRLRGSLWSFF